MSHIRRALHDETGATAVEYGILAAFIGLALVLTGPYLWQALVSLLGNILDQGILG